MKENNTTKKTIYAGLSIFNILKDYDINLSNKNISLEDKKYLSLYLGILNSKNDISDYIKSNGIRMNIDINPSKLTNSEYLNIYNKYFADVFDYINFNSLYDNFNFLLTKDVVKLYNKTNGRAFNILLEEKNKILLKK